MKTSTMETKINSVNYGGKWIAVSLFIGGAIPFVIWLVSHKFLWGFCVVGVLLLTALDLIRP